MLKSLTTRLALGFAIIVTTCVCLTLWVMSELLSREMLIGLDFLHEAEFNELIPRISDTITETNLNNALNSRIREHTLIDASMYYVQIHHSSSGEILFKSENLGTYSLPVTYNTSSHHTLEQTELGILRVSEFIYNPFHIQIASNLETHDRLIEKHHKISIFIATLSAFTSLILGFVYSRFSLQPVREIRKAATEIDAHNLGKRIIIDPARRDEVAELARLLNHMFDRLQASFEEIRRFAADASHELKTPLTLLRLNAEKLRTVYINNPECNIILEDLLEETDNMRRIIDQLLFMAKVESGNLEIPWVTLDAKTFLDDFAEDARVLLEDKGLHFKMNHQGSGGLRAEPTLIRQLLFNLVSNAARVSPTGGSIVLESDLQTDYWILTIEDEGPGLSEEQLENVFKRFVRINPSDSGYGLGLSICRSIANLHQGTIAAENRKHTSGLRVILILPRKNYTL